MEITKEVLDAIYASAVYNHDDTNKGIIDMLIDEINESKRDRFNRLFHEKWDKVYYKCLEDMKDLKYVHAALWMTDCYDNYDSFADWFYDYFFENSGDEDVERTFICADIVRDKVLDNNHEVDGVFDMFFGAPYDNKGEEDVFWRVDEVDFTTFSKQLHAIDAMIDAYMKLGYQA